MTISVREAREELAEVGMDLRGNRRRRSGDASFIVTTPVGTELTMRSQEVVRLVRDLRQLLLAA